ncbi:MAG: hypothetical protein ACRD2W_04085 [Acidimicrobiales bacterium]
MSPSIGGAIEKLRSFGRHLDPNVSSQMHGQAYGLTMFSAIMPGQSEALAAYIDTWEDGQASPLARIRRLHCSRVHILDELVYQGEPQVPEPLNSSYLIFTASFDGGLDEFLDDLIAEMPGEADALWGHCVGYPGTADGGELKRWTRHNQIDNHYFLGHYPSATVRDVRQGLEQRRRVAKFAAGAQGMDAATLQQEFRAEFGTGSP